jgi:ABC-2 type transport system permease protein
VNVVRSALAQGRWELRTIMRNGEQLLVSFGLPALALVALHRGVFALPGPADALGLAGVLAMAVLSSSFTSQAIALGFDRRWGVLRMLSTTPLGPGGLVRGKAIAVAGLLVAQAMFLGLLAAALGWRGTTPAGYALLALFLALGSSTFVSLAVVLGGTLRAEAVIALANLLWVVMLAAGALLPLDAGSPLRFLPPGALGEGLRAAVLGGFDVVSALVLLLWGGGLAAVARRALRWD